MDDHLSEEDVKPALGALSQLLDYSSDSDVQVIEVDHPPLHAVVPPSKSITNEEVVRSFLDELLFHDVIQGLSHIKTEPVNESKVADEVQVIDFNPLEYRPIKRELIWDEESLAESVCSVVSSSTSSSSSSDSDEADAGDDDDQALIRPKGPAQPLKTKKEKLHVDLPPIEDLQISVPAQECVQLGTIITTVDDLVVVKAFPSTPAIDIDSVLFLEGGTQALGKVFDVFGPVSQPFYSVRFNSGDHIKEKAIKIDSPVFYAPRTEYANFVFVEQLRKLKGTDASWRHDEEPPVHKLDFSDDEEEIRLKREAKQKKLGSLPMNQHSQVPRKKPCSTPSNPFYRQQKRYNPRDFGPIRWNSHPVVPTYSPSVPPPNSHGPRHWGPQYPPQHPTSNYDAQNQWEGVMRPPAFSVPPPSLPATAHSNSPSVFNAFYYGQQSVMQSNHQSPLGPPPPPPPGH
ncbi:hypothetical protein TCAL_00478 [Tigriopus californicus]|uniref:H/ACA ribonucleoprotein complex non-core subunit NAF1 n=1 Tax=Tigriopus californicus TaxID=6832 RepID=A0A553NAV6_TIGCA|nr:H/ACA ribonucleoprotein complex non-core subunit NAF1-like [Tigriopus californicus]TRY62573.1 hypothetical protein TCAL_00478 [Tigriopus californicus]|eukprot:TCALIF_00478-PA protein Name:"Similar to CG10341 H/ACA ribonucleoprotein complex non-core subunit NAF1 (Drosophila melanogaster)" AED:0.27 eAED:0.27 QI:0/-1/0/1/-1/1/1/0/456